MNKDKIIRKAKERTKVRYKTVAIIYDNLTSKNRLTATAMSAVLNDEFSKTTIERIQRYLVDAGAVISCDRPCRKQKSSFFDTGITWSKFNCLPNGELI